LIWHQSGGICGEEIVGYDGGISKMSNDNKLQIRNATNDFLVFTKENGGDGVDILAEFAMKGYVLDKERLKQEKIREGYGVKVANMGEKKTLCEFNTENYYPPKQAIESLARRLLPVVQEYFSKEENRKHLRSI